MSKTNPRTTKATNVDPARLAKVESLLALQMTNAQIKRAVAAEFGVSERTVATDIERVLFRHEPATLAAREKARDQMRMSLRQLYQRCLNSKDWRSAVAALDRICKLDGLYAPEELKVEHGGVIAATVDGMTSAAQRARTQELLQRAGLPVLVIGGDDQADPN